MWPPRNPQRQRENCSVQLGAVKRAGVASEVIAEAPLLNGCFHIIGGRSHPDVVQVEVTRFSEARHPVKCNPTHDFGVKELPGRTACLPDTAVRQLPVLEDEVCETAKKGLLIPAKPSTPGIGNCRRSDDLAVHVQLQLPVRRVANSYRLRVLVAGQPAQLPLK